MNRRAFTRPTPSVAEKRWAWRAAVTRGGCVMCRAFPIADADRRGREADIKRIEGHHVLAKRHLRGWGEHHFWDARNGMALCSYHHHRHEWRMQPVPFALLPDDALEFAAQVELLHIIEREYPGIEGLQ